MVLGTTGLPTPVSAGIFSAIWGEEVSASAGASKTPSYDASNLQNMTILQPSMSSNALMAQKKGKTSDASMAGDVEIVSNNALSPNVSPVGNGKGEVKGTNIGGPSFDQISVYVVRRGDSLSGIAKMYDVTVDTILSANNMQKGDALKEGDVLLILPFSGVEHTVVKGDTLQGIAKKYQVDIDEILISNDLDVGSKLSLGEKLMIPGGSLSGAPAKTVSGIAKGGSGQGSLKTISGYFINPVPSARKSRGSSSTHRGVDLAAPTGTAIRASAAGRVTFARSGYNGGFGNLVIVVHDNGTETLYAHQSKIATTVGARVAQGETIGYVGSTGRSTGPHLHFEVHGAKNPGNDWSWAK